MHRFVFVALFSTAVTAAAPQVAPRFEVASVKPMKPGSESGGGGLFPGGRFAMSGTVQELVRLAYGVEGYQVLNAPGWATTEKFVIDARAPAVAGGVFQHVKKFA